MPNSGQVDRFYFRWLYFREPNGILFEIATDGPGFAADEPMDKLGEKLALPPFLEGQRKEIEAGLKPVCLYPSPEGGIKELLLPAAKNAAKAGAAPRRGLQPVAKVIGFLVDARDDRRPARPASAGVNRDRLGRQRRDLLRGVQRKRIDVAGCCDRIDQTASFAACGSSGWPIASNAKARRCPIRRGAKRLEAASGTRPSATNGVENFASMPQTA